MKKIEISADFYKYKPRKPIAVVNKLINFFSQAAIPLFGRFGDDNIVFMDESLGHIVILITAGTVDIWRKHDNLLVATVTAPSILGLQGSDFRYQTHTFRRQHGSEILFLTRNEALEIINENNLLDEVLTYQSFINDFQTYRDILMVNNSAYEIICMLLTELADYPNRSEISVEKFILTRTQLARSGVLRILADLRYGGFIEMEKGKLIRLGIPFPQNY